MEMKDKQSFDFEAFKMQSASRIKKGETLLGKDGVFTLFRPRISSTSKVKVEFLRDKYTPAQPQ
ncbi:MAG: hypothetical protein HYZ15_00295 [Sphingobacteriales bacterium]|nr:hypothetical protein [Sphingobacteriales bacterium]